MNSAVKLGVAGFAVVIGIAAAVAILRPGANQSDARQELQAVYSQIQLGASKSEVRAIIDAHRFPHLKLKEVDAETLLVQTPLKWGARNWALWLEMQEEKVRAVRIRFHDNRKIRPVEAPEDKIGFNHASNP